MSSGYDVFISYNAVDREWAENGLAQELRAAGLQVATEYNLAEYVIGDAELRNIERALRVCRRVIIVLSPEALNDPLRDFSAEAARALDPAARVRKVLPLMLRRCEPPDWVKSLRLTMADFTDERFRSAELKRLVRSIQSTLSPPTVLPEQATILWRWRIRYYRHQLIAGLIAVAILVMAGWITLQIPPFEPRAGWRALGLDDPAAKQLYRFNGILLVTTDTDTGCQGPDTGLWRSTDHGMTWQRIAVPALDFGLAGKCDRAAINHIIPVSDYPERLYAATSDAGLLRSDNLGLDWEPIGMESLPVRQLWSVAVLAGQPEQLYVTGTAGLWRSKDNGASWQRLDSTNVCRNPALGIDLPPSAAQKGLLLAARKSLYIAPHFDPSPSGLAHDAGLYASLDGECWQLVFPSNLVFNFMALAASPTVPDEILFVAIDRTRLMHQILYRYDPHDNAQNLWETDSPVFGLQYDQTGTYWYASNVSGEVWQGLIRPTSADKPRNYGIVRGCEVHQCYSDIAAAFDTELPLFLTDGRVFQWTTVTWREALLP